MFLGRTDRDLASEYDPATNDFCRRWTFGIPCVFCMKYVCLQRHSDCFLDKKAAEELHSGELKAKEFTQRKNRSAMWIRQQSSSREFSPFWADASETGQWVCSQARTCALFFGEHRFVGNVRTGAVWVLKVREGGIGENKRLWSWKKQMFLRDFSPSCALLFWFYTCEQEWKRALLPKFASQSPSSFLYHSQNPCDTHWPQQLVSHSENMVRLWWGVREVVASTSPVILGPNHFWREDGLRGTSWFIPFLKAIKLSICLVLFS